MGHASYSAAMNHFTHSFIHIHTVWCGLKYYTVLLMCRACKCMQLISDLFNTTDFLKYIFLLWGGVWEGKFPTSICGLCFCFAFLFVFWGFFLKQYEGENEKKPTISW